jgi:hypothetical protein
VAGHGPLAGVRKRPLAEAATLVVVPWSDHEASWVEWLEAHGDWRGDAYEPRHAAEMRC